MKDDDLEVLMTAIEEGSSKDIVLPDAGDMAEQVEFKPPVEFKEGAGKPIGVDDQLDDFTLARKTYHNVIENGHMALEQLLKVAINSDHPRAYEVVSTMMKTIGDSAKDLLKLQEQMIDLKNKMNVSNGDQAGEKDITEEGGFEGTTEQLLASMEKEKDKE